VPFLYVYALSNGEVQYQGLVMVSLFCMYSYGWPHGMLLLAVACCAIAEIEVAFSLSPFVQQLQILLLPTFIFILEEEGTSAVRVYWKDGISPAIR
jgi:hypothetical protein